MYCESSFIKSCTSDIYIYVCICPSVTFLKHASHTGGKFLFLVTKNINSTISPLSSILRSSLVLLYYFLLEAVTTSLKNGMKMLCFRELVYNNEECSSLLIQRNEKCKKKKILLIQRNAKN